MNGWIKLHRKLLSSNTFQNEKLLKVFIYCLLKATHTDHQQIVGKQKVDLKPGQFVFGRKKAALELDMKESTVRDYINVLKNDNVIAISPTNKFSVVTIENWGIYQSKEDDDRQQNDSKMTAERQQNDTNKNVNNAKNGKKEQEVNKRHKYEICDMRLAELLLSKIKDNNPNYKQPNLEKWANDVRLMRERDNRTEEQIEYLINWSQQNDFWQANILSPAKLREKFDTLVIQVKREKNKSKVVPMRRETQYDDYNYGF